MTTLDWALQRVGDRWTLRIVQVLLAGPSRFNDLLEQIDGLAPNILTNRLRQLERDGLAVSHPYTRRPVRHRYELTDAGRELGASLTHLAEWGARHGGGEPERHHEVCGSPLETRLWCPTCERLVDDDDEGDELHHV